MLTDIGNKYGTAKNTHVTFGHTLLDLYEPLFERFVNQQGVVILEIGVLNGASLRTWEEYFQCGSIYGFDIDRNALNLFYHDENQIDVILGDQSKEKDLKNLIDKINNPLDIIIDDGSHVNKYTLISFEYLWPHLNSGGIYIIEDTICTYDKVDMEWPGMNRNRKNMNVRNNRKDIDKFLLNNIMNMDLGEADIFSIQIYRNVIIFQKG